MDASIDVRPRRDRPTSRVRRWRSHDIAEAADASRATVFRVLIPEMVRVGVLTKRGRFYYGLPDAVELWLLGKWPSGATP